MQRWERLAPLTGALAVVVVVVAVVGLGGDTPDIKASAGKVLAYYQKHRQDEMNAAFVMTIAAGVLMFYVGWLRHALRRGSESGRLANVSFAGGVVAASGLLFIAAVHLALADSAKYGDAELAHTLNALDADDFLPLSAGIAVLVLAASAAALRGHLLPKWLGIIGVVAGVAGFTPVGFPAFLVCLAWIIVTSITFALQRPQQVVDVPAQPGPPETVALPAKSAKS